MLQTLKCYRFVFIFNETKKKHALFRGGQIRAKYFF